MPLRLLPQCVPSGMWHSARQGGIFRPSAAMPGRPYRVMYVSSSCRTPSQGDPQPEGIQPSRRRGVPASMGFSPEGGAVQHYIVRWQYQVNIWWWSCDVMVVGALVFTLSQHVNISRLHESGQFESWCCHHHVVVVTHSVLEYVP